MLNEVKHLANVSCQVLARDSSDATLCQDDEIAENLHFGQLLYYLLKYSRTMLRRTRKNRIFDD